MAELLPVRRILTANLPLSSYSEENGTTQPAVAVYSESITSPDIGEAHQLGASCNNTTIFSHAQVPTSNDGFENVQPEKPPGVYMPAGVHVTCVQARPGFFAPMHRTTTTDYIFVHSGELTLITPSAESNNSAGQKEVQETICKAGDVIIQRGTMHGWANKGTETVQYFAVMIGSEAVSTEIEGTEVRRILPDWFPGQSEESTS